MKVVSSDGNHEIKSSCKGLFIRFKNIPKNELSGVYDGDCGKIRDEIGVSCYQFIKNGENYNIILSSISVGFLSDLMYFLEEFKDNQITAFLIEGDKVGIGTYGEPLVQNIKIIKELHYIELAEPKPKYKMDLTNPQLRD